MCVCVYDTCRLQAVISELREEEKRLTNHIASLKQEEMCSGYDDPQALKKKELELAEVIQNISPSLVRDSFTNHYKNTYMTVFTLILLSVAGARPVPDEESYGQ